MAHHRKLDLSMFRDDDEDDLIIAPKGKRQVELTDLKSRTFNHGKAGKTKKDLEKEAEEKKRIEEEKAQALVMAEYEEAFEKPQYGVKAGRGSGFVRAGGAPVQPHMGRPFNPPAGPSRGPPTGPAAMGGGRTFRREPSPPPSMSKPRGKRQMDSFLEEIKGNQQTREQRLGKMAKHEGSSVTALAAWENSQGRPQISDAQSTNLFITNLPHTVTEDSLGKFFAKYGPIGTLKIMWPRGIDLEHANRRGQTGLTGFVAFMKRPAAEKAVNELDNLNWGGSVIRVAFGNTVRLPARPIYDLGNDRMTRSPSPRRGQRRDENPDNKMTKRSRSRSISPPRQSAAKDRWLAKISAEQEDFVLSVARTVKDHGERYEENLKANQRSNPEYSFLFDDNTPGYHIYKLALNRRHRVPTPPPEEFDDEGYASVYSSDSAEDSERERISKGRIGKMARRRFESTLRSMSGKRVEIARAMEFALNRAEAADEVAELVCQSLQLDSTPVPRKIARLHLVSDILHNSASPIPNVWKYRLAFEKRLPAVFSHLNVVCQSLDAYSGKISAEVFRGQIHAVLDVWDRWIVYTQDVAGDFRARLDGIARSEVEEVTGGRDLNQKETNEMAGFKPSGFKSSGFKSSFKPATAPLPVITTESEDVDGEEIDDVDGAPLEDDVDGAPLDDVDGAPLDGEIDGVALDDVDGVPLDDDVDGAPLEDVDGEALEADVDGEELDMDVDGKSLEEVAVESRPM